MKTFKQFIREAEKNPCWAGYKQLGTKTKRGKQVPNCIPEELEVGDGFIFEDGTEGEIVQIEEAEYQGREVELNKPMSGDVKKSKVYVKNDAGNVVKVEFGDPNMTIKNTFLLVERRLEQDITATIPVQKQKQDIGVVKHGNKSFYIR